jgi:UDP-N-acetylmuramoylalanine--D-glutamate ligase
VTVVGAGISNRPLIGLLAQAGVKKLVVCDKADSAALGDFYTTHAAQGVEFHLGENYLADIQADVIFRTPGMHPGHPALQQAVAKGACLTSEMEAFFALCPCPVFAVTGSDGKTTTTTLIAELLKKAGRKVWLGGNIGHPLLAEVDSMTAEDVAVLELSSFQLHSMTCRPAVAVVTNVAPNHLDVHPSYEDYIEAKAAIFANQTPDGRLVLNLDNEVTRSFASRAKGQVRWFSRQTAVEEGVFCREDGMICAVEKGNITEILPAGELKIPGVHNVENMMTAFAATAGYVSWEDMRFVARSFTGVAHRLETVRVLRGVRYINDSIASSPSRTMAGLACFGDKVILIAGGKDKGVPFDELGEAICQHVKRLYLTGWTAQVLQKAVQNAPSYQPGQPDIFVIDDFTQAVQAAARDAQEGDVVLLSPACTSFDKFKNFEERGNTFRHIIENLE